MKTDFEEYGINGHWVVSVAVHAIAISTPCSMIEIKVLVKRPMTVGQASNFASRIGGNGRVSSC